eukprot:1202491-Rhodomonas_salina.4
MRCPVLTWLIAATCRRVRCAGTDEAYGVSCLRARYAMSCTDTAYGATARFGQLGVGGTRTPRMMLRACGTEIACGAMPFFGFKLGGREMGHSAVACGGGAIGHGVVASLQTVRF